MIDRQVTRRSRLVAAGLVVAFAVVAAFAVRDWLGRAPFSPDAVHVDLKAQVVVSSSATARDVRDELGDRYSWLSALRDTHGSSGVSNSAMALDIPGGTTRPVTFSITSLPYAIDDTGLVAGSGDTGAAAVGPSSPLSLAYVTIGLVLVKPNGDVWWAERLTGHA